MALTAQTIIDDTLAIVGNISPNSDEYQQALRFLDNILKQITTENFSIVSTTQDTKTLVASTGAYTYGTGGDINSERPMTIQSVFLRDTDNDDHPVTLIQEDKYNSIVSKDTEGLPYWLFYKPDYPLGSVTLYPVPDDAYTLYINTTKTVLSVTSLSDSITLPGEYNAYLTDQLVASLARVYGYSLTNDDLRSMTLSKANIKTVNNPKKLATEAPVELIFMGRRK